jgi:hypothetical protein
MKRKEAKKRARQFEKMFAEFHHDIKTTMAQAHNFSKSLEAQSKFKKA